MTWLQDAQQTLREKMSRAEDFYSQMLLRQGFRNWLKVGLHHSGEMIPRELAAAMLSPHHSANSLTCSTTFAEFCYPYSSNIIPFFRDLLSAPHSPSLSSTQNFLLHTAPPPSTLSPCSLLVFLHSCAHYPSLPQSQHCSIYWARGWERKEGKKPFSPVSLSSSPVQGLSLHSGGESRYLPHSLPHEEVLLGMV